LSNTDRPNRIVAVLLGACEWPKATQLPSSSLFKNSAAEFKRYLINPKGLNVRPENILDLFDDPRAFGEIDGEIENFLDETAARFGEEIKDLVVYYTGHGAFTEGDQKYCLAVRSTRGGAFGASGYRVSSLARTLNKKAGDARKFVVIDACYAGAALMDFVPQSDAAIRMEEQTMDGLAESGTALLCAASAADVALAPRLGTFTMFSEAILKVLTEGSLARGALLSFDDLRALAANFVREKYKDDAVQPEIHIPDQRRGDLSKIKFLPNPARREGGPIKIKRPTVGLVVARLLENLAQPANREAIRLWAPTGAISGSLSFLAYYLLIEILQNPLGGRPTMLEFNLRISSCGVIFGIALSFCFYLFGLRTKSIYAIVIALTTIGWILAYQAAFGVGLSLAGYSRLAVTGHIEDTTSTDASKPPAPEDASKDSNTDGTPPSPETETVGFEFAYGVAGLVGGLVGGLFVVVAASLANRRFRRLEAWALALLIATSAGAVLQLAKDHQQLGYLVLFVVWQCSVLKTVSFGLSRPTR
jgi:hypothetical protein